MRQGTGQTADSILIGSVLVLDKGSTRAEAIAVADGKVFAVGARDEVMRTRGQATAVHDLSGSTIIPGFNDTHAHLTTVGLKTLRPSLAGAGSIRDILVRIAELARSTPKGEWIVTMPVGEPPFYFDSPACLAEGRMPTRDELDSVAPDHPVYLSSAGGYWGQMPCYSAMNSLGLKRNGIDRNSTPAATGIEIQHDAGGEPTGVFIERNFVGVIELDLLKAVPRFTAGDRLEALRRALKLCHAKGTTSIYEGHGCAPDVVTAFRQLSETGELTMRSGIVLGPTWNGVEEAERIMRDWLSFARGRGIGDAMLRIAGVFLPCSGDTSINQLMRPNLADLGWADYIRLMSDSTEFERMCMLAGKYDLRVHTVVSDRLREAVPILERLAQLYPIGERRWVVEHLSKSNMPDLQALKRLGLGVTLIPAHFLWKSAYRFADLSSAELDLLSPAKQLVELGVPVSAGTDATPYDPLMCLWAMVTRQERTARRVMGPNGCISNEAALRLLTVSGAWLTFEEAVKGPLLSGNYADLAVLARDPLAATGDEILENECKGTMVGGRWVYGPN